MQAQYQRYGLYGAASNSGVALIDGADARSVLQGSTLDSQFGRDTFNDIQVKTGGADASTPLGLGAVMTVVTESGTDRFHRRCGVSSPTREWNADNTPGGQSVTVYDTARRRSWWSRRVCPRTPA